MIVHNNNMVIGMFEDLDKAQRQWRERTLFGRQRRRRPWRRLLLVLVGGLTLLLWQEEVLAWLAELIG